MEEALKQYTIKNAAFEGPLDLLLSLIEKRKLLINDISLAQVTDDFIAYINAHKNDPEHPSAQGSTSSTGYPLPLSCGCAHACLFVRKLNFPLASTVII
jgi:hypothetical protein